MTDKQTYTDLAERCEAAEAGSRELDAEAFHTFGMPLPKDFAGYSLDMKPDPDSASGFMMPVGEMHIKYECAPYSTSLDAAMTLLPEGWGVTSVTHPMPKCTWAAVREYEKGKDGKSWTSKTLRQSGEVHAKTPALALLAAICRAMGEG